MISISLQYELNDCLITIFLQVQFDFKLMFENANESYLIDNWPAIKDVPFKRFGTRIEKPKHPITRKNDDVFKMLTFLKLLPTPKHSFDKAVRSFLLYTEVNLCLHIFMRLRVLKENKTKFKDPNADPMEMRNQKLLHPYIIAGFSVTTDNVAYYVDVQDRIFSVCHIGIQLFVRNSYVNAFHSSCLQHSLSWIPSIFSLKCIMCLISSTESDSQK